VRPQSWANCAVVLLRLRHAPSPLGGSLRLCQLSDLTLLARLLGPWSGASQTSSVVPILPDCQVACVCVLALHAAQIVMFNEHAVVGSLGHNEVLAEVIEEQGITLPQRPLSAVLPAQVCARFTSLSAVLQCRCMRALRCCRPCSRCSVQCLCAGWQVGVSRDLMRPGKVGAAWPLVCAWPKCAFGCDLGLVGPRLESVGPQSLFLL